MAVQTEILSGRFNDFHMENIPYSQNGGNDLTDDGSYGGTHHTPLEDKDEDRVKDDIDHSACQRGDHGKFRVSVGTDYRV